MKKTLLAAIVPALFLTACATSGGNTALTGATAGTAATTAGTYYCWKDRLHEAAGELSCNWATSVKEACDSSYVSSLQKARVSGEPARASRCENGQWLVSVKAS